MIYLIDFPGWEEDCPVEGAYKMATFRRDWRTMGKLEDAEGQHWYHFWYARGKNHREEDGMIVCDIKDPVNKWFINIESLEDLLMITEKLGEIKLRPPSKEFIGLFPIIDLFD